MQLQNIKFHKPMELTKEQIQSIEIRLQKNGLTYWDIRMEILDHLVSEIEAKMAKGESYTTASENAFFKLNLNGNLESLNKSRLFGINKIVRKQYFNKIKTILTTPKSFLIILLSLLVYFLIYQKTELPFFKWFTMFLLLFPAALGIIFHLKEYTKKQKSGYLVYASFYIFFSFLMLNGFLQFCKPDGIIPVSKTTQKIIWVMVTLINSVFSVAGILIYLKTRKKITLVQSKLSRL